MALCLVSACIPSGAGGDYSWPRDNTNAAQTPRLEADSTVFQQDTGPAIWERREVTPNASEITGGSYTVQAGDTLGGIGNRTGAGADMLAKANGLEPPYTIFPGQNLIVPGGRYHRVSEGESGIGIARAYAVPWSEIVTLNDLEEPYILRIGQRLLLPRDIATAANPPDRSERAAAFDIGIDDIVSGGQPAIAEGRKAAAPSTAPKPKASTKAVAIPSYFNGKFMWPIEGKLTSSFGSKGGGKVNNGVDIGAARGTPIRAAADGVVSYSGDEIAVFGGLILISHGSGWVTAYGHAERLDVVRGQAVKAGQIIGMSGESGYATQPQLHFEIRKDLKPVDPVKYLPAR